MIIHFPINTNVEIQITSSCSLHELTVIHLVKGWLVQKNQNPTLIFEGVALKAAESIRDHMRLALHEAFPFNYPDKKSIGYVYNENMRAKQRGGISDRRLWSLYASRDPMYQTWIFNHGNKIIVEISPCFRWHRMDPKPGDTNTSYDEFMESYKVLTTYELSRSNAQLWLKTASRLRNIILGNGYRIDREWYERYKRHKPKPMFRKQWRRMR